MISGVHQADPAQDCKEICKCQGYEETGTHACSEKVNLGITDQGHVSNNFYCMNNSSKYCCIFCKDRPIIGEYFINHPKLCNTLMLLEDIRVKTGHTVAKILHSNPTLCLKLLLILKQMYNIKRFHSFINKITRNSKIRMNLRLCKRFAQFCFIRNLWPRCWLQRAIKNISVKDLGKGVQLFIKFDNSAQNHTAIIDSGSDFSILPFIYLKQLQIHGNRLNKTVIYNVTSATSHEKNAVLGSILLRLQIQNEEESFQVIDHPFLIPQEQI